VDGALALDRHELWDESGFAFSSRLSQALLHDGAPSVTVRRMHRPRAHGRHHRPRRRPTRSPHRGRRTAVVVVLAAAFLLTLLLAAFGSSPTPDRTATPASASRLLPPGRPLPQVVALHADLRIQLPIAQQAVTAIGYHAAGEDALPLEPVGRQANEGLLARLFHGLFGGGGDGLRYYQLPGGEGPSTGGLDVGAAVGTDVYAPVDGAVVSVRSYVLNGEQHGHRIEIQPSGSPSLVVVLTRLRADPALTVGSPVSAGRTKVGVVLDFSDVERQALAAYTQDAGNHVTLAVHPAATLGLR